MAKLTVSFTQCILLTVQFPVLRNKSTSQLHRMGGEYMNMRIYEFMNHGENANTVDRGSAAVALTTAGRNSEW